jgi:K+-transporting ATPase c subunit
MTERMAAKQKKAWENKSNAGQIGVANDALRATASGIDALIKELAATMRREQITRVVVEVRGGTARCSMLRRSVSRVVVDD